MEKYDLAVLLVLGIAVLAITSFHEKENSGARAAENYADNSPVLKAQTLPAAAPKAVKKDEFNEKRFDTANGLELTVGSVEGGIMGKTNVSLPLVDRKVNFTVDLPANKTLQYARIKGILIVPRAPTTINTAVTSYYPEGRILDAGFQCPGVDDIGIYSPNGAPDLIITNASLDWSYDAGTGILSVSTERPVCSILIYWNGVVSNETKFIEDSREAEKLTYAIKIEESGNTVAGRSVQLKQKPVDDLGKKLNEIQDKTEKVIFGKQEAQNKVAKLTATSIKLNQTQAGLLNKTTALENRISSNVLISPMRAGLGALVGLVLLILLIDAFFLRGGKNEK